MSFVHFPQNLVINLRREGAKHIFFHFFIFCLFFDDSYQTVNSLPLEVAIIILNLSFHNRKGSLCGVIELGRCSICMQEKINENLFNFYIGGDGKFLHETMDPYLCMVFLNYFSITRY